MIRNKKSQKALELEQKLAIQEFAHANNAKYVAVLIDGVVNQVMMCGTESYDLFLSNPTFLPVTDINNSPEIGDFYDKEKNVYIKPENLV